MWLLIESHCGSQDFCNVVCIVDVAVVVDVAVMDVVIFVVVVRCW